MMWLYLIYWKESQSDMKLKFVEQQLQQMNPRFNLFQC